MNYILNNDCDNCLLIHFVQEACTLKWANNVYLVLSAARLLSVFEAVDDIDSGLLALLR